MNLDFSTVVIKEGLAKIKVPEISKKPGEHIDHSRSEAPVFYNPVMRLNRDTAVLALLIHQETLGRKINVCEPMCGSGVRGVRFALESGGIDQIILGDLSPGAVKLTEINISINNTREMVHVRLIDANLLLNIHSHPMARFDYIDVDPYGSPSPYLDSAIRASHNDSMIALTATDMAPLCGVKPEACIRKYGGRPLRVTYCHELALRLVIGALVRQAAIHEYSILPCFGYYSDHYVRFYAKMVRGVKKANASLRKMGYILHCWDCLNREVVTNIDEADMTCNLCGGKMSLAGPLWLGEYAESGFCDKIIEKLSIGDYWDDRLFTLIFSVKNEIGFPPTFYDIDKISSFLNRPSMPTKYVLKKIRDIGYRATISHFDSRGIKTDAPPTILSNLFIE